MIANAFKTDIKNTANTHVISFGGKLLALFEAGLPYRIDPATLDTIGEDDMSGTLIKDKVSPYPKNVIYFYFSSNFYDCYGIILATIAKFVDQFSHITLF